MARGRRQVGNRLLQGVEFLGRVMLGLFGSIAVTAIWSIAAVLGGIVSLGSI